MPTLVERLQMDAADSNVRVATLLRRAKISAKKLGLKKVETWMDCELNGYTGDVPEYRSVVGALSAWNPYNGWIPVSGDEKIIRAISTIKTRQAIDELESCLLDRPDESISAEVPHKTAIWLRSKINQPLDRYAIFVARVDLIRITNAVRNAVLEWALSLEEFDIKGSEFDFSLNERRKAGDASVSIRIDSIGSFNGQIGTGNTARDISSSIIDVDQARRVADQLRPALTSGLFSDEERRVLSPIVDSLAAAAGPAHPDQSRLRSVLQDLRNALSGATGNLIASGIVSEIGRLFGS